MTGLGARRGVALSLILLAWLPLAAWAEEVPASVEAAVRAFVGAHPSVSGQATELQFSAWRGKAVSCSGPLEVSSGQTRLRGRSMFVVRCANPAWSTSVAAKIVMPGEYWVATRFLPAGTLVAASDLRQTPGDLATLPEDVVRSDSVALGRVLTRGVNPGSALQLNALRENTVIKAGERVRVNMQGSGFSVTGDAVALTSGASGESVKLKTRDGQQLVGRVIKSGLVEVPLE